MSDDPRRVRALLGRVVGLADEPTDDDDLRLRKRVLVIAGYMLGVGPLQLPALAQRLPLSWIVAATMLVVSAINLVVLARTKRFERYVGVLIVIVLLFPAVIEVSLGGLAGASAALVFAFLGPVFALIGLGPRRAARLSFSSGRRSRMRQPVGATPLEPAETTRCEHVPSPRQILRAPRPPRVFTRHGPPRALLTTVPYCQGRG